MHTPGLSESHVAILEAARMRTSEQSVSIEPSECKRIIVSCRRYLSPSSPDARPRSRRVREGGGGEGGAAAGATSPAAPSAARVGDCFCRG